MNKQNRNYCLLALFLTLLGFTAWQGVRHVQERQRIRQAEMIGQGLSKALYRYTQAHDGRFPSARDWEQELDPYMKLGGVSLPMLTSHDGKPHRFAMLKSLSNQSLGDINQAWWDSPVFFESIAPGPSAADEMTSLPSDQEANGFVVVYLDGAEYVPPGKRDRVIQQARHNLKTTSTARLSP